MPRRCCCACRERRDSSELIRLFIEPIDSDEQLRVSSYKPSRGRTAWLCYQYRCVDKITKKPKILRSALRKTPELSQLRQKLIAYLYLRAQKHIQKIHRSGRIFDFQEKPEKTAQYWIYYETGLANPNKMEYLRLEKVLHFQVILGENPPSHLFSTIGIQSGKFSQQLLQELRLLQLLLQDKRM